LYTTRFNLHSFEILPTEFIYVYHKHVPRNKLLLLFVLRSVIGFYSRLFTARYELNI